MKVIISACLLGVRCRYDGGDSRNETAIKQRKKYELIPVCPEESGGYQHRVHLQRLLAATAMLFWMATRKL
jgi:uncharacterized protein YbbK (DUF523 family)